MPKPEAKLCVRVHRGSLAESCATSREITATYDALIAYFKEHYPELDLLSVSVSPASVYDIRIGWNTHLVTGIVRPSLETFPLGYTDRYLPPEEDAEEEEPDTILSRICEETGTTESDWKETTGPETRVGLERYYAHVTDGRVFYGCDDQGAISVTEVTAGDDGG